MEYDIIYEERKIIRISAVNQQKEIDEIDFISPCPVDK